MTNTPPSNEVGTFDLAHYVREHIPIVAKNEFSVTYDGAVVQVFGQHSTHINHRGSVFGSSISTALTLAAWGYMRQLMAQWAMNEVIIVIAEQQISFTQPVLGDFSARSLVLPDEELKRLQRALDTRGKARVTVGAQLYAHSSTDSVLAQFTGAFALIVPTKPPQP